MVFCSCKMRWIKVRWSLVHINDQNVIKIYIWIFEVQTHSISIFAPSFQGLSNESIRFSLRLTEQLTWDKTWLWAISSVIFFLLLIHWKYFRISFKNRHQIGTSLRQLEHNLFMYLSELFFCDKRRFKRLNMALIIRNW